MNYAGLNFDRSELVAVMRHNYADILAFITHPVFQTLFSAMMQLPANERPNFVREVWLEPAELKSRGLEIPSGVLIQTSAFGDRRPTLFVIKKYLPDKFHRAWENVNWTFNNEFADDEVPRDPESCWRLPLSVSVQNALMSNGLDLQAIPSDAEGFSQALAGDDIVKSERRGS